MVNMRTWVDVGAEGAGGRYRDVGRGRSTYHQRGYVHYVTPGEESEDVDHGESSKEAFCEFHFGFINEVRVLRPQRSALDKHFDDSLSTANGLAHLSVMNRSGRVYALG